MAHDIAVIGGGVIGSVAAFHFAERGRSVLWVDDARPGATAAAAGMLSPSFELSHDAGKPALERMLGAALERWAAFAHRLSDDPEADFGYHRRGVYGLGYHARPQGTVKPEAGVLPAFSKVPSLFAPQEGAVDPAALLATIRRRMQGLGVTLVQANAELREGEVLIAGEPIHASHVILATGASPTAKTEGLMGVKGEAFLVRLDPADAGAVPTVVRSPTVYFVPRTDGTLYIGATEVWPGAIAATADELWQDAERLLPCLSRAQTIRRFEGFRPFISRDGPLIARDRDASHLIRALGHHRNGVLLAPVTAEAIEDLIM